MLKYKKQILIFIQVCVTLVCFYVIYRMIDYEEFVRLFKGIPLWFTVLIIAISIIHGYLSSVRWRVLNLDKNNNMSAWLYFRYTMMSKVFNMIMPGAVGGDIIRSALIYRKASTGKGINAVSVLTDRLTGLVTVLVLGFFAALLSRYLPDRSLYILLTLGVFIVVIVLLILGYRFSRLKISVFSETRIIQILNNLLKKIETIFIAYRNSYKLLGYGVLISIPIQVILFVLMYVTLKFLQIDLSFLSISAITAIVWFITALPISLSGMGVREVSYVLLLTNAGVNEDHATLFSVYVFVVTILFNLTGILFFFNGGGKN